jgi:hypothetical protein
LARREGETEEERETRLAAEDVHIRLEQARQRELKEAYWRSRATSKARPRESSHADSRSFGRRDSTPRATLAGVRDAAPLADATWRVAHRAFARGDGDGGLSRDFEVEELARAASRVGATPDVSRRVAAEVLAAEHAAVDAVMMRRASTRQRPSTRPRGSIRAPPSAPANARDHQTSALPRRVVEFETPRAEISFDGWDAETAAAAKGPPGSPPETRAREKDQYDREEEDRYGREEDVYDALVDEDDSAVGMTSALRRMARTPLRSPRGGGSEEKEDPPTSRFRTESHTDPEMAAVSTRGIFGASDSRILATAFSEAAAAAVEDGLRRLVARTNGNCAETGSPPLAGGFARRGGSRSPREKRRAETGGQVDATSREDAAVASEDDAAWISEEAFGGAFLGDDREDRSSAENETSVESVQKSEWSAEDVIAVQAAHAAARRAEEAVHQLVDQERIARVATKASVARLLDARVSLAAATAKSVSEEAAGVVASAVARAASLRLTLDDEVGDGGRGARTCEALASVLCVPLPSARKL